MDNLDRVTGWWLFAGILLAISGVLNIIWGIAAISESHFFVAETHYILSNLNTWGWITLILGVLELMAGFSLFSGAPTGVGSGSSPRHSWRSSRCSTFRPTRSGRWQCSRCR